MASGFMCRSEWALQQETRALQREMLFFAACQCKAADGLENIRVNTNVLLKSYLTYNVLEVEPCGDGKPHHLSKPALFRRYQCPTRIEMLTVKCLRPRKVSISG